MPIDFSDMLDEDSEAALAPRDIFFTLNRDPSFSFPRDIQTEVMNRWFERRNNKDNVIKLNVGSGKTLVGLLILQSSLNENKGPALYVAPDKQLTRQAILEAESLGIETVDDPRDPDYLAGEKICIINVYKLFNGKSVFGVNSSKISIGTIVIDDAHACVSTITEQFKINLNNNHEAYRSIFYLLSEDLKGHNAARFLDIEASDPRTYMEVPFWSWEKHHSEILETLHRHRNDEELQFSFPLLREILQHCRCIISGQTMEIEPHFPATDLFQSFRRANRRIYMTATLADDSVIATHFGADPTNLGQPIVPSSSQSMGERMILMPQELNTEISTDDIKHMLAHLSKSVNVVVIVPSSPASRAWSDIANQILINDNVADGIDRLRNEHVGLTVLVNRYDGIDLPGDACRVLAIVDLPEVNSYADLIDSEVLSGTTLNLRRQIERIEQGMGRGVRSNEDHCAVLLVGPKLTSRLRSPEGQEMLTPATKAQLELSRKIAKKLINPSIIEICDVILQCLNRDPGWIKISKKSLLNLESDDELRLDKGKLAIKLAFDFARSNQYDLAIEAMDKAIDDTCDQHIKAWLLSKKAAFQHSIDANGAQKTLLAAHKLEPGVLKPIYGASYKKLTPIAGQQATTLIANHQHKFLDATSMKLYANTLCTDLQFNPDRSDRFEAAVNDLAWFIGIKGQRPEKNYNEGPDNLWALPNGEFLIIECKSGVTSENGISKKDAGQLDQSASWFSSRYPSTPSTPIIIHPKSNLDQGASIVNGMRVIDSKGLEKLRNSLRSFCDQLTNPNVSSNATEIATRLSQFGLDANTFVRTFSISVKL